MKFIWSIKNIIILNRAKHSEVWHIWALSKGPVEIQMQLYPNGSVVCWDGQKLVMEIQNKENNGCIGIYVMQFNKVWLV